jgi:hypothetical protein
MTSSGVIGDSGFNTLNVFSYSLLVQLMLSTTVKSSVDTINAFTVNTTVACTKLLLDKGRMASSTGTSPAAKKLHASLFQ